MIAGASVPVGLGEDSAADIGDNEHPKYFLVEPSYKSLDQWEDKKKGYLRLCGFCIFMVLYIVILALQLNIGESYAVDSAFRNLLTGVDGVFTQDQLWDYLYKNDGTTESGIMSNLLVNTWYNTQQFTTSEQGYVLNYNKLVGGVLMVQQRSNVTQDGCTLSLGSTSYDKFYSSCFLGALVDESIANTFYSSSETGKYYYGPAGKSATTLGQSFMWDNSTNGFSAFFSLAEGRTANLNKMQSLKANLWTDKATRQVQVKFAFYNGNIGLFTFCAITFNFDLGGIFTNGNNIRIQSMNMEPYRNNADYVRLALEVIFMAWVSQQTADLIVSCFVLAKRDGGRALINLWTVVDAVSLVLFYVYIGLRIRVMWLIYSKPIQVPTNRYQEILEQVAGVQNSQLVINFLNIFVGLLRFFKYYRFQERLSVLNNTFSIAFTDLYHFLIMFTVIFGGYAVMAHILFGPSVQSYSSLGRSLETCWEMILGAFDYPSMAYVNPEMAAIFFISFMFLVFFVLVNVLLAILIDAYTKACEGDFTTIASDLNQGLQYAALRFQGIPVENDGIAVGLRRLRDKGIVRASSKQIALASVPPKDEKEIVRFPGLKMDETIDEELVTRGYPVDLVDNVETVLRENALLRQRVQIREAMD